MGKLVRTARDYAIIGIVTLLVAELIAFAILSWSLAASANVTVLAAMGERLRQHPLADQSMRKPRNDSEYQFLPTTQLAFKSGTSFSTLQVGQHGFILNGADEPAGFPEKAPNLVRVVILGGSSAAGATASGNDKTIAAQLEKLMNRRGGARYQVLNFGVGGNYSYGELQKLITEVAYLDPDVVIMFDGFNDAHYARLEHLRAGLPAPLMNWADFSYRYFDTMAGLRGRLRAPPPVMTYAYLLVEQLIGNDPVSVRAQREALYAELPATALSDWVAGRDPAFTSILATNLEVAASWTARRGIAFIGYLQPHPWEFKDLSCEREQGIRLMVGRLGPTMDEARYAATMQDAFQAYATAYQDLDDAFANEESVRFIDMRRLFEASAECIYNDPIHYNDAGNLAIAERMRDDLVRLEGPRSN